MLPQDQHPNCLGTMGRTLQIVNATVAVRPGKKGGRVNGRLGGDRAP